MQLHASVDDWREDGAREAPGAIAPISKLPIFLDLRDKPAALAGDTAGLAWKAELIAAAGADVRVFSAQPSEELRALAARRAGDARFRLVPREWTAQDLAGAAIAVADLPTLAEAAAFKEAGDARGVLVNTVDKGATCDFYFGVVVSRSPIMIGATTDGTAPILGQSVRRAIELAVPDWLGQWGDLARAMRPEIKRRLAPGRQRRAFWEAFAELAMTRAPDEDARARLEAMLDPLAATPRRAPGAFARIDGVCEADCLTIGEVKRLQAADLIVEDAGVAETVRAFYRREATRLTVGRAGVAGEIAAADVEATIAAERADGRAVARVCAATGAGCACKAGLARGGASSQAPA
ncbi:MAG: hypothetical protein IPL88_04320 [Rhizobiales bacterium]|nr:hypothetical protein [Hyphomicrobiales bacterium]